MSRKYIRYQYIFPPRVEYKILPESLNKYDDNTYYAQVKLDGSNCSIYVDGKLNYIKNRHDGDLSLFRLKDNEMNKLHQGEGFDMFVGEYMNKSKKDKNNNIFNHKFVIFDVIVNKGKHLTGSTYIERYNMLKNMFELEDYDEYFWKISDNIFLVKSFEDNFYERFKEIIKIDMLEGFVLKRKTGKLERGTREKNNIGWAIKARKGCLNYTF